MTMNRSATLMTKDEIQNWLIQGIARSLKIDADEIDTSVAFDRYGMDSVVAVQLTGELEKRLGYPMSPTLMYDYPTIDALSQHVVEELASADERLPAEAV